MECGGKRKGKQLIELYSCPKLLTGHRKASVVGKAELSAGARVAFAANLRRRLLKLRTRLAGVCAKAFRRGFLLYFGFDNNGCGSRILTEGGVRGCRIG